MRPHRWQPTRLPHPWDSPGKNTGVGCHFLLQCMKVKSESEVVQSCPTLPDRMDCSLPGSSIHGIFQARVLEWGAIAFSVQVALVVNNSPTHAEDASSTPELDRSPGGGHGNPLQYSCLENPMERGDQPATVQRVAKSRTWLKQLSMQASQPAQRKLKPRAKGQIVLSQAPRWWRAFQAEKAKSARVWQTWSVLLQVTLMSNFQYFPWEGIKHMGSTKKKKKPHRL